MTYDPGVPVGAKKAKKKDFSHQNISHQNTGFLIFKQDVTSGKLSQQQVFYVLTPNRNARSFYKLIYQECVLACM